jgi:hypothetical protein
MGDMKLYDVKIYEDGRNGREMETIRGIDDITIVESLRMVFTRLGVKFVVKEYQNIEMHDKCDRDGGYGSWAVKYPEPFQNGHYNYLCESCWKVRNRLLCKDYEFPTNLPHYTMGESISL